MDREADAAKNCSSHLLGHVRAKLSQQ